MAMRSVCLIWMRRRNCPARIWVSPRLRSTIASCSLGIVGLSRRGRADALSDPRVPEAAGLPFALGRGGPWCCDVRRAVYLSEVFPLEIVGDIERRGCGGAGGRETG